MQYLIELDKKAELMPYAFVVNTNCNDGGRVNHVDGNYIVVSGMKFEKGSPCNYNFTVGNGDVLYEYTPALNEKLVLYSVVDWCEL